MWICAFHLLIFYGFSSKLFEPQFKLDDLRNHFCNSDVPLTVISQSFHGLFTVNVEVLVLFLCPIEEESLLRGPALP